MSISPTILGFTARPPVGGSFPGFGALCCLDFHRWIIAMRLACNASICAAVCLHNVVPYGRLWSTHSLGEDAGRLVAEAGTHTSLDSCERWTHTVSCLSAETEVVFVFWLLCLIYAVVCKWFYFSPGNKMFAITFLKGFFYFFFFHYFSLLKRKTISGAGWQNIGVRHQKYKKHRQIQ